MTKHSIERVHSDLATLRGVSDVEEAASKMREVLFNLLYTSDPSRLRALTDNVMSLMTTLLCKVHALEESVGKLAAEVSALQGSEKI